MRVNWDRLAVDLGSKAAQSGKGLDWHPRSLFVERRESGQFCHTVWFSALLLDHDGRRMEMADLVDQSAILNPYRGAQQSGTKQADSGSPPGLALVYEVLDSVDEALEHVESEEGVVAWLGTDSECVLELLGEGSLPTLGALSHRDQGREPSRATRIHSDGAFDLPS